MPQGGFAAATENRALARDGDPPVTESGKPSGDLPVRPRRPSTTWLEQMGSMKGIYRVDEHGMCGWSVRQAPQAVPCEVLSRSLRRAAGQPQRGESPGKMSTRACGWCHRVGAQSASAKCRPATQVTCWTCPVFPLQASDTLEFTDGGRDQCGLVALAWSPRLSLRLYEIFCECWSRRKSPATQ